MKSSQNQIAADIGKHTEFQRIPAQITVSKRGHSGRRSFEYLLIDNLKFHIPSSEEKIKSCPKKILFKTVILLLHCTLNTYTLLCIPLYNFHNRNLAFMSVQEENRGRHFPPRDEPETN